MGGRLSFQRRHNLAILVAMRCQNGVALEPYIPKILNLILARVTARLKAGLILYRTH